MQSEAYFYNIWDNLPIKENIYCGDGELIILNKGVLSSNIGPDFQGVQISLNNKIISGDVEIHIRTSDWYFHGHHLNPDYNNVILHLVWNQENKEIFTNNGIKIPELSFKDLVEINPQKCPDKQNVIEYFFQRYARKVAYCDELLQFHTPEDVFWILFARTLGYKRNADTMEMFARVFYPSRIRQLHPDRGTLSRFLNFVAFENSDNEIASDDLYLPRLRVPWREGGRPANAPMRRVAYLSELLHKYWYKNLFLVTAEILMSRKSRQFVMKELSKFFHLEDSQNNPGKMRITRFLINWLIPLMNSVNRKQSAFQIYLLDLYWLLPAEEISTRLIKRYGNPINAAESQGYYELDECHRGNLQFWLSEIRIPYGI